MTREEEKDVAVRMWREIAARIREGDLRNIDDIEDCKKAWCLKEGVDWEVDCWLCEYFVCATCPLYVKYNASCNEYISENPYTQLRNGYCDYKEEERESFADMAECIAKVIEETE